ncbi:MAG: bZIP transcription factor [Planctomycetes bacterium]|nr:bZIP transcription factor [Planctomycetota bacterium]
MYDSDTVIDFGLGTPGELEETINSLERENARLKHERQHSLLFWEGIAHLTGMGFALLACTAAGQSRVRIVYDPG